MPHPRLHFSRTSERRTSDDKLKVQLEFIAEYAIKHYSGWAYDIGTISAREKYMSYLDKDLWAEHKAEDGISSVNWLFSSWISFYRTRPASPDPDRAAEREYTQRQDINERAASAGHNARFSTHPWVARPDRNDVDVKSLIILKKEVVEGTERGKEKEKENESHSEDDENEIVDPLSDSEPTPLSSIHSISPGQHYSHLYGLDAQIRILLSAVQAAADSDMRNRFHSLLYGPPGTGKTDILTSTYTLLSELNISCLSIDATSTTEAGMRKLLLDEDEILPEVILVEEIEKAAHSFKLLLGIMDDRGTVSQLNARRTATRKVPALVLASANDYSALQKMDSGALLSRFSNEIHCPRANREILAKILEREIGKIKNGSLDWIEPSLIFCFDERGIGDPRMIKRVCLCGKERLLDGSYQRDLELTMRTVEKRIGTKDTNQTINLALVG